MGDLQGKRILVVGASSGVGKACAQTFFRHDANVIFAARRHDLLTEAIAQVGGGHAVTMDVSDELSISRAVAEVVSILGGVDAVIYTAGMSPIRRLSEMDAELWTRIFAINTFGPSLVFKACMPHLSEDAILAVMSSDSAFQPRHSLVPYAASKAALEASMEGWRTEEIGGKRFMTVGIGPTQPSDFSVNFTPDEMAALIPHWTRQGFRTGVQSGVDVAELLSGAMSTMFASPSLGMETLLLRAPEPKVAITDYGHSTLDT